MSKTHAQLNPKNPFDMNNKEYGDLHRIIVQCLMSGGMLGAKGVKTVFTEALKYCGYHIDEKEVIPMNFIQKTIREINEKINKYDLAIKSVTCEITSRKFYVFIISVENPILKMQKAYTPFEVELFQKIMDRILRKYKTFTVPVVECINYTLDMDGHGHATLRTAEQFIEKMINLQYFAKIFRNKRQSGPYDITLGPRAIREMEPILKDIYHDVIVDCLICKQIMLHGYVCPSCECPVHRACYSRHITASSFCKNEDCKSEWKPESIMKKRERDEGEEPPEEAFGKPHQRQNLDSQTEDSSDTENEDGMPRLQPIKSVVNTKEDSSSSDATTESEESSS